MRKLVSVARPRFSDRVLRCQKFLAAILFLLLREVGNVGMNPAFGPLVSKKEWFVGVIPYLPAEHQRVSP